MFAFPFVACLLALIVYFMCILLRHFAGAFNILSQFIYPKKKKNEVLISWPNIEPLNSGFSEVFYVSL